MKKLIVFSMSAFMLAACGNNETKKEDGKMSKEKMEAQIDSMEAKLHAKSELEMASANATIVLYADYANNFPDDPKTPDYLFKAGQISSSMQQGKQAINYFNTVYTKYPKFEKASTCLFLQGFIYETQLNDTAKARGIYEQVIQKYPNERIAEDAKASIDNLGKSPEELMKEFEKKNQGETGKPKS